MQVNSHRPSSWRQAFAALVSAALVASLAVLGPGQVATASAQAPGSLSPAGGELGATPTLSWARVPDATSYRVEVLNGSGGVLWGLDTVQRQAVPTVQMPRGLPLTWRVRSTVRGVPGDWATASFTLSALAAPTPTAPAAGADLKQPDEPVVLSWTAVQGALEYVVEISTDALFTDERLITTVTTKSLHHTVQTPGVEREYNWRVRARLGEGVFSRTSTPRSYTVVQLDDARRRAPLAGATGDDAVVDDAVLDWDPIPGAQSYDLQISTDSRFLSIVHERSNITGTSYARPQTLGNDQYYWRVRGKDVTGFSKDFDKSPIWRFQRAWPDQPRPLHPAADAVLTDPPFFQWTPASLASRYTVEFSPDQNFDPNKITRCTTVHTTLVPQDRNTCWPQDAGTYWWRVLAHDEFSDAPPVTDAIAARSLARKFTYLAPDVELVSPTAGQTVAVPTMTWKPVAGAERYRVTVTAVNGTSTQSWETASLSWTPRAQLAPGQYRWMVQTLSRSGRASAPWLQSSQPLFVVPEPTSRPATAPTIVSPVASGTTVPTFRRFPLLRWTDAGGDVTDYKVWVKRTDDVAWQKVDGNFSYPQGQDPGSRFLAAGTYEWKVEAFSNGAERGGAVGGRFRMLDLPAAQGHRVALTGTGLLGGQTCAATLPSECQDLRQTPLLAWEPQAEAGYYKVWLSHDRELTKLLPGYPATTESTAWLPHTTFEDSQAGSAYFWHVQPCKYDEVCTPEEYPKHAFNKKSNPVVPVSPGVAHPTPSGTTVPVVQDDVTLRWRGYLASNSDAPQGSTPLATKATLDARQYRVQVSTDPTFGSSMLDDVHVDQRSFTSYATTYPEGRIYWRVQAFDGSNRPLPWSGIRVFEKRSPAPRLVSPLETNADKGVVPGNTPLTWTPLGYAARYQVEVYRENDTNASAANRVLSVTTPQVTLTNLVTLPRSEKPYVWRVRRLDAMERNGAWSSWGRFTVRGGGPEVTAPATGATVAPRDGFFAWKAVPDAVGYRFERRPATSQNLAERQDTTALGWAPASAIEGGDWAWRVVALDAQGAELGASAWRTFRVDATPVASTGTRIEGSGGVGTVLTGFAPTWTLPGVSTSYQWLRDGWAIEGATAPSYLVRAEDVGRRITLRATGRLAGYDDGTSTSNEIAGATGAAATVTVPATISGSGAVGSVLTLTPPTWDQGGVETSYAWLRDGKGLWGQHGLTYTVGTQDIGTSISVQVVGRKPGLADATVLSNAVVGVLGPMLTATAPPHVTGTPKVGGELRADPGTWPADVRVSYQWLRNGTPIKDAVGPVYRVAPQDAALDLSVVVVAKKEGQADGTATSAPVKVPKMVSTTHATASAKKITRKDRATITVNVSVEGLAGPTGPVMVKAGRKKLARTVLKETQGGAVTLRLPRLKKPKNKIKVFYVGTAQIAGSTSRAVKLVVKGGKGRK